MTCARCRIPAGASPSLIISRNNCSASSFLPSLYAARPKISLAANRHSLVPDRNASNWRASEPITFLIHRQGCNLDPRKIPKRRRRGRVVDDFTIILERRFKMFVSYRFGRCMQAGEYAICTGSVARKRGKRFLGFVQIPRIDQSLSIGKRVAPSGGFSRASLRLVFVAAYDGEDDESARNKIRAIGLEEFYSPLAPVVFFDLTEKTFIIGHGAFALNSE